MSDSESMLHNVINGNGSQCRESVDKHDDILQNKGIWEPWRSAAEPPQIDNQSKNSSCDFDVPDDVFSDILEEGNMSFVFSNEATEVFNSFGKFEEMRENKKQILIS